jgi:hypothetical protein
MSAVRTVVCYLRTANPSGVGQRLLAHQFLTFSRLSPAFTAVLAATDEDSKGGDGLGRVGVRQ